MRGGRDCFGVSLYPALGGRMGGGLMRGGWGTVLDPVMGDMGKLYVSPDVVPMYKSLLSHADLITPNQFETEYE